MDVDRGRKIYDNITRLSYKKGMRVNEVCRKANVSSGIIGDLKHGRRDNIGAVTVDKLSRVLECTPDDILSLRRNDEPMPDVPAVDKIGYFNARAMEELRQRPELRRLVRAAMKATATQVKATAVLLESITKAKDDGGIFMSDEDVDG